MPLVHLRRNNGTESIRSWQAKEESAFTKTLHSVEGLTHHLIPPGAHTYQADVETAHGLIPACIGQGR